MANNILFNLVSLGCPKNRVDAERILSVMTAAGFVYTEEISQAQVIIVNTCAFIEAAVEESINSILDYRMQNRNAYLVVAGCLPLRYREELAKELTEVDLFITPEMIGDLVKFLNASFEGRAAQRGASRSSAQDRILTTPGYAYLKIAEGCSRACRYCTIPSIRGPLRSADVREIEQEATAIAARGVRELVLVAQDLTSYGADRREKGALVGLLKRLETIKGIRWIRLMYLHPGSVPRDLPVLIKDSEKILPYLDIPFQHISDTVLRSMGRPWKGDKIRTLVQRLRAQIDNLVLRTTLMVGYPTEGEKEFKELRDFVSSAQIEHVGVFAYSPEEGTRAWSLGDPVPQEAKEARAAEIRAVHAKFVTNRNRGRVGRVEECLVEGVSEESELLLQGRCWDQAPEIDGTLYITAGTAVAGEIHRVKLTDAYEFDLFGEIVDS